MKRSALLLLFVLQWHSALPIQVERVEVVGAALMYVETAADGTSGVVAAQAERACLTIAVEGHTTTGILIHLTEHWDAGCMHVYVPMVRGGDDGD